MKLCTVVLALKTKTEFVRDQNPIMPPHFAPNFHHSWFIFNGTVQTLHYRRPLTDCIVAVNRGVYVNWVNWGLRSKRITFFCGKFVEGSCVEVVPGQRNKTYTSPMKQLIELGRRIFSGVDLIRSVNTAWRRCKHSVKFLLTSPTHVVLPTCRWRALL